MIKSPNVKMYDYDIESFPSVRSIPEAFIYCIRRMMTYAAKPYSQSKFYVNKETKATMAEICGVTEAMVEKNVRKCMDAGIILKSGMRGAYVVNPYFMGKGDEKAIQANRRHFTFIDGKWIYEPTI